MLKMLKVLWLLKKSVKRIHFFKGKFSEEFKYATNFLLDDKLKIEKAETLTYIEIKRIMILALCTSDSKTIVHYKFPCFEGPYWSEHIWCYGKKWGSNNVFYFFCPKIDFSTPNIICDILYIEILLGCPTSLHFQLYKNIWFIEIRQKCYELPSFDCEMVQIYQYMNM